MHDAPHNDTREAREDLIDTLLAISLLSRRMAQNLARLSDLANMRKGDANDGQDEQARCRPYRIVRA